MPSQKHKTEKRNIWSILIPVTKRDLEKAVEKIMSAISDALAIINTRHDEVDAALDVANTKLTGITDDVAFIKEELDKLQNSPGQISQADQDSLNALIERTGGLVTKVSSLSTALGALDDTTTRPTPPVA